MTRTGLQWIVSACGQLAAALPGVFIFGAAAVRPGLAAPLSALPAASSPGAAEAAPAEPGSAVAELGRQARALEPLVHSAWVGQFLRASSLLPAIPPRTVYHDEARTHYYSQAEAAGLPEGERAGLTARSIDEEYYYNTRYGTPLAYARPLEILASKGFAPRGSRILDFGYGGIGQLRLLASLGAGVCGVEIDPLARALYSEPGDQGVIRGARGGPGRLVLVHGRFPSDQAVKDAVGTGYDLVISKNVLKRGYVHPEQPIPDRQMVHLGVEDAVFARTLFEMLNPGGRVLIYNICPAPGAPGKPYIPWADGRSPISARLWEEAGLRVVAFNCDDSRPVRAMAHALGWDTGEHPMDLQHDLFALYTLLSKPGSSR